MASLRLEGLSRRYGSVVALDDLWLEAAEGELLALLGPSGSGKTTTLRLVAGHEPPSAGRVFLGSQPVERLSAHRRDVGMVYQSYALFPHLTVFDNVAFGLRMRRLPWQEINRRVDEALALVRLGGLETRYPRQLSGGQQQRVALARAIVIRPALLLLDEPLSALDRKLRQEMQLELRQLQRQLGLTTVYVTHDQEEALALADRLAVLFGGHLQQAGTPRQIYEQPANAFVADFIGVANLMDVELLDGPRARLGQLVLALAPGADPPRPGPARLALRPEQIRLSLAPSPGALPARVSRTVYLGTTTHVFLALDNGPELVAFVQNTGPRTTDLQAGQPVWASWPIESLRLVRD